MTLNFGQKLKLLTIKLMYKIHCITKNINQKVMKFVNFVEFIEILKK